MGKEKGRELSCRAVNTPTTQPQANSSQLPAQNNDSNKWAINLSSTPLSQAKESLLSKGSNYAIAPKNPPHKGYITSFESFCQKLDHQRLRNSGQILTVFLEVLTPLNPILPRQNYRLLTQIKKDRIRIVLTADKGVAMVVMDRKG